MYRQPKLLRIARFWLLFAAATMLAMPMVHNLAWAVPSAERGFEPLGCLAFDRLHPPLGAAEADRSDDGEYPAYMQCECLLCKVVKLPFLPSANPNSTARASDPEGFIVWSDTSPAPVSFHLRPPGRAPPSLLS